jgi:hypothetical protein
MGNEAELFDALGARGPWPNALEIWAVDDAQKALRVMNGEPVPIDLLHGCVLVFCGNQRGILDI